MLLRLQPRTRPAVCSMAATSFGLIRRRLKKLPSPIERRKIERRSLTASRRPPSQRDGIIQSGVASNELRRRSRTGESPRRERCLGADIGEHDVVMKQKVTQTE